MTSPAVASNLDDMDKIVVGAFQSLHQVLTSCEKNDRKRAEQGVQEIRNRESFLDKCKGEKEVKRFLEAGDQIIKNMWDEYTKVTQAYTSKLQQHQQVPRTLKDVSTNVWAEVTKSLQPISRDINTRMQQNHWKGRGADDYMKQLPMQLAAVTEFGQYVEAATIGVDVPGQLQAAVFISASSTIREIASSISSQSTAAPRGQYFTQCATAVGYLKSLNKWWTEELMTGRGSWMITLDNHVREMTSSQVKNPSVIKGDKWPHATKDTKDIPKPSHTPVVDRQSGGNTTGPTGRPNPGKGVDQRDYHAEDKGGHLW